MRAVQDYRQGQCNGMFFTIITYNIQEMKLMGIQYVTEDYFGSVEHLLLFFSDLVIENSVSSIKLFFLLTSLMPIMGLSLSRQGKNGEKYAESRYSKGFETSGMHSPPEIWRKDKGGEMKKGIGLLFLI